MLHPDERADGPGGDGAGLVGAGGRTDGHHPRHTRPYLHVQRQGRTYLSGGADLSTIDFLAVM